MDKEELKQEAEESAKKFFGKPTDLVDLDNLRIFKNGYLAGATENGIQWHDLRKDPNYLPDTERKVIVMRENDVIDFDKYFKSWGWQKNVLGETMSEVIAWTELPQFKE